MFCSFSCHSSKLFSYPAVDCCENLTEKPYLGFLVRHEYLNLEVMHLHGRSRIWILTSVFFPYEYYVFHYVPLPEVVK